MRHHMISCETSHDMSDDTHSAVQYLIVGQLQRHLNEGVRAHLELLHNPLPKCTVLQHIEVNVLNLLPGKGESCFNP